MTEKTAFAVTFLGVGEVTVCAEHIDILTRKYTNMSPFPDDEFRGAGDNRVTVALRISSVESLGYSPATRQQPADAPPASLSLFAPRVGRASGSCTGDLSSPTDLHLTSAPP
jgi:hypothetical protein